MTGNARYDVLGIGNALVDVLADTQDAFLTEHGLIKGSMTLIDAERAAELYEKMAAAGTVECSGGSAANTMVGIASLGGRSAFVGKVTDDHLGGVFASDLGQAGVHFGGRPTGDHATGRSLILVTPDAQRTMQTFLGSAAHLTADDVDPDLVASAQITYLEGYLWDPPPAKEAFLEAAKIAHDAGRKVALSLSDPFCVERHRAEFLDLVRGHVDILFSNADEILSLCEVGELEDALARIRELDVLSVITLGAEGAAVVTERRVARVPAVAVSKVVDTTGAGDLFAAGFLHGHTRGLDPETSARIGAIAAGEIISHYGARPKTALSGLVEAELGRSQR